MKQMLNTLNISEFISKCTNYIYNKYVTGSVKIGHVGTNYTPPHNISYHSTGIEYFHSVPCIVKPIKRLICTENCMAKQ